MGGWTGCGGLAGLGGAGRAAFNGGRMSSFITGAILLVGLGAGDAVSVINIF
jgi:hypothetical protein